MKASHSIPPQQEGFSADIIELVTASDIQEAKLLFLKARQRMYDINRWGDISEGLSASFRLTDNNGLPKEDIPNAGDLIMIDIPGPGSSAGEGYDWVRVELVEDERSAGADEEWSVLKVRPSGSPSNTGDTAHFFKNSATSTFIVKRKDATVTAEIHGRNETPNTSASKISDKVRNAIVGSAAASGASKIQWQKLARGLLIDT